MNDMKSHLKSRGQTLYYRRNLLSLSDLGVMNSLLNNKVTIPLHSFDIETKSMLFSFPAQTNRYIIAFSIIESHLNYRHSFGSLCIHYDHNASVGVDR